MYAVDFAMPVGTDIVAARDGVVFDVASTNFKGGPDADQFANLANLAHSHILPSPLTRDPRAPNEYMIKKQIWILGQMHNLGGTRFLQ